MKKTLLLLSLALSNFIFSQTQPIVHNSTFTKIAKNSGSDCACSGWINKSLADQAESSSKSSSDVVKFDNIESDGVYQEVAVESNSNYTLDLEYWFSDEATTTQYLEVIVLKGSSYIANYTPLYAEPASAEQDNFGYRSLIEVDDANNHVARTTVAPPGNTDKNNMSQLTFSTGSETSIAIFIRAVGPYDSTAHGDSGKDKGWMNGDTEVRVDNLVLVNTGATASVNDLFMANITVYPNPASQFVKIESNTKINKVEVYNLLGKTVLSSINFKGNLDISSLSKGMYMLKFTSGNSVGSKKLIIK